MYEIIYIKADYEPWWMFEEWENTIVKRQTFETIEEAQGYLDELNQTFKTQYDCFEVRKDCFFAYWTIGEQIFCEGCDDNLQIFHGIISMKDGKPSPIKPFNN
ncbi:DUF1033 family protein [Sporosarcina sp. Sa2YVA2]|uniref:DUF1033 family protein n=1 Tax=Sporosarcina quadrami TaxID=2762234 RepID=A0ABR8U5K5_9BACL|nr:DUF1033 family protein [Sporosarcina quadrami]MBD7983322.1 DUF1033 family protein [Sporosarcina quadrami]